MREEILTDIVATTETLIRQSIGSEKKIYDVNILFQFAEKTLAFFNTTLTDEEREWVCNKLIQQNVIWSGESSTISNRDKPEPWVNSELKKNWSFWPRYRQYLRGKVPPNVIRSIDESTDQTLNLIYNPQKTGLWDRRGMIVGHVQSGKTSDYIGLINKAADAGYKIIIVLAGMYNNLRAQTQIRLEEGFLGIKTFSDSDPLFSDDNVEFVGVGSFERKIVSNYATTRSELGDFSKKYVAHLGFAPEQKPCLFVVKKNVRILKALNSWVAQRLATLEVATRHCKIVKDLPLLLIDDEADNASVDTHTHILDENGNADKDHDPTSINREIRRLLNQFGKCAYIGYTATPFANIFIPHRAETENEGADLFPSSFITTITPSSNYVGPVRFFGKQSESDDENNEKLSPLHSLIHLIPEEENWIPVRHKRTYRLPSFGEFGIPESLQEAILSFILSTAVRNIRKISNPHRTMLIHVTRFNDVQTQISNAVKSFTDRITERIQYNINNSSIWSSFEDLWLKDFVPTTNALLSSSELDTDTFQLKSLPDWEQIKEEIPNVLDDLKIKIINGSSQDILDYEERKQLGLTAIVIGGDKLSRGLTLEGLSVSYFMRASRMYDTLMQMGRWFGYRDGYLDTCRLYITNELYDWFGKITDINEELREEFDVAVARGLTPEEYGLKVKTQPGLLITSPLKMRETREILISLSGHILETVGFINSQEVIHGNRQALDTLIDNLNNPVRVSYTSPQRNTSWDDSYLWKDVSSDLILDFFKQYKTQSDSHLVDSSRIHEFIDKMNNEGELLLWNVALIGGGKTNYTETFNHDIHIHPVQRGIIGSSDCSQRFSIKRLLSNRDETIDIETNAWEIALELSKKAYKKDPGRAKKEPEIPRGSDIRRIRGLGVPNLIEPTNRPLLLLYPFKPVGDSNNAAVLPETAIGFGISFPYSAKETPVSVPYRVNTVWQEEYNAED